MGNVRLSLPKEFFVKVRHYVYWLSVGSGWDWCMLTERGQKAQGMGKACVSKGRAPGACLPLCLHLCHDLATRMPLRGPLALDPAAFRSVWQLSSATYRPHPRDTRFGLKGGPWVMVGASNREWLGTPFQFSC